MKAGKFILQILPILDSKRIQRSLSKLKSFGKKAGKYFGDSFKVTAGQLMKSAISGAWNKAQGDIQTASEALKNNLTRDEKISNASKKYGVDSARIDALLRAGQASGISEDTMLSSLSGFQKQVRSGSAQVAGKDIVEKLVNAIQYTASQKEGARKDYLRETVLGGGLDNLTFDPKALNKVLDQLNLNLKGEGRAGHNGRISAGANMMGNARLDETNLAIQQQQMMERAVKNQPNTVRATMANELKNMNTQLSSIFSTLSSRFTVLEKQQELAKFGNDVMGEILEIATKIYNAISGFFENVKKKGFWNTLRGK